MVGNKFLKASAYFLSAIVLLMVLLPAAFPLYISFVKKEQKQLIADGDNNSFITITLSKSGFEKFASADEKEIILNGFMYDIAGISHYKGNYIVSVIADKKETFLQSVNANDVKTKQDAGNDSSCSFFSFLYFEEYEDALASTLFNVNDYCTTYIIPSFDSPCLSLVKPPPNLS